MTTRGFGVVVLLRPAAGVAEASFVGVGLILPMVHGH
jgi:hypothetical protein